MSAASDRLLHPRPRAIADAPRIHAAFARHLLDRRQLLQSIHRRAHHVVRIRRSETLRQNVRDAGTFHNSAHGTARDDAGAWRCWLHENSPRTMLPDDLMR